MIIRPGDENDTVIRVLQRLARKELLPRMHPQAALCSRWHSWMQTPPRFFLAPGAFQLGKSFTWVNGSPDDPAQGVPSSVIKPVVEFVEALLSQEAGGAVVEIPVKVTRCDRTVGAAPVCSMHREPAQFPSMVPNLSCKGSFLLPVGLIVHLQR